MAIVKGLQIYHRRPPLLPAIVLFTSSFLFAALLCLLGVVGVYEKDPISVVVFGMVGTPVLLYLSVHSLFRGIRCDGGAIYLTGDFRTKRIPWDDIVRFSTGPSKDLRPVFELVVELKNGKRKQVASIISAFRVNDYLRDTCTDLEALRQTHVDGLDKQETA